MKRVTAADNPHYKGLKRLARSVRERRSSGHCLLDGMHLIEAYHRHCGRPAEIVVSDNGLARAEIATYLASERGHTAITQLSDRLFDDLAMVDSPSGIMAVVAQPASCHAPDAEGETIALDGVQDPGNVGSILRSAAAAGVRQIVVSRDCANVWSPKVLRAAMGAHFQLDLHQCEDLVAFLSAYRGQVLATCVDAPNSLYEVKLKPPIAWVFGSEGQGVRPLVARACGLHLRIPMAAGSESVNVAAAAAVCLFERVRRKLAGDLPEVAGRSG